jgi:hypothetical protein
MVQADIACALRHDFGSKEGRGEVSIGEALAKISCDKGRLKAARAGSASPIDIAAICVSDRTGFRRKQNRLKAAEYP